MGAASKANFSELDCRVAEKLSRPNLLLLKHLVYVLYLISKNSETNKMDASNLAICISPNILAPENDQNLSFEAQKDLNNKVCLPSCSATPDLWSYIFFAELYLGCF